MAEISELLTSNECTLVATLVLMLLDIITGIMKGVYNKSFDSSIMRKGLFHKISTLMFIIVAAVFEMLLKSPDLHLGMTVPTIIAVCIYVIVMEVSSIVENLAAVNPNLAELAKKFMAGISTEDVKKDE